jgi:ABC-type transporter Mla subunit MlaD
MSSENEKKIKFTLSTDNSGFSQIGNQLDMLIQKANKLSEALSSVSKVSMGNFFGGGDKQNKGVRSNSKTISSTSSQSSAPQTATDAVLKNAEAFGKIANSSKQATEAMTNTLKRSVAEQQKTLKDLDRTIENLTKRYENLAKASTITGSRGVPSSSATTASEIDSKLPPPPPNNNNPKNPSGNGRGKPEPTNFDILGGHLMNLGRAYGVSSIGQAGLGAQRGALGLESGNNVMASQIKALRRGQSDSLAAMMMMGKDKGLMRENKILSDSSDPSGSFTSMKFSKNPMTQAGNIYDYFKQDGFENDTAKLGRFFNGARKGIGNMISGRGGLLDGFTDVGKNTMGMEDLASRLEQFKQTGQFQKYENYSQMMDESRSSRDFLARSGGTRAGYKLNKAGIPVFKDNYLSQRADLRERGLDIDAVQQQRINMRSMAGSEGYGYGASVEAANLGGYGAYGSYLASSIRTGGGSQLSALGLGAASGTKRDVTAAMELGQGVMGMNQFGETDQTGIFGAIQASGAFTGRGQDFAAGNRIMAGLQGGNLMSLGGASPYQSGANILSASRILGKDSSYQARDYLANKVKFPQLVDMARQGGKLTNEAQAFGMTNDTFKQQLSAQLDTVMRGSLVSPNASDPYSKINRELKESGMSTIDFAKKLQKDGRGKDAKMLLSVGATSMGLDGAASQGLSDVVFGYASGGSYKKGGVGMGAVDAVSKAKDQSQAELDRADAKDGNEFFAVKAGASASTAKAAGDLTKGSLNLNQTAGMLGEKFENLGKVVDALANKMSRALSPAERQAAFSGTSKK